MITIRLLHLAVDIILFDFLSILLQLKLEDKVIAVL
jgi:hypothetical protein